MSSNPQPPAIAALRAEAERLLENWRYSGDGRSMLASRLIRELLAALDHLSVRPEAKPEMTWTDKQVLQIIRNLGADPECGACAEIAYCGSTSVVHTCAALLNSEVVVKQPPAAHPEAKPVEWTNGAWGEMRHRFDCDVCLVRGVVVDEDGCCISCGHDARVVRPAAPTAALPESEEGPAPECSVCVQPIPDNADIVCRDCFDEAAEAIPPAALPEATDRINTRCPSCGHTTLVIGDGGLLVCSLIGCKDPTAIGRPAALPEAGGTASDEITLRVTVNEADIILDALAGAKEYAEERRVMWQGRSKEPRYALLRDEATALGLKLENQLPPAPVVSQPQEAK